MLGHSWLPQQQEKKRDKVQFTRFFKLSKLSLRANSLDSREDVLCGRLRMCDPHVTEPRRDTAATTRCRRRATQRPTNLNDLQPRPSEAG